MRPTTPQARFPFSLLNVLACPEFCARSGHPPRADGRARSRGPQIPGKQGVAPMNATTILGMFGALAFVVGVVALLEHLDRRARERRWQQARDSFTR